ncbi:ribosome assembly cofactor RimP [Sphingobacteriaceae bacterium]|nr:ribosome assembly cofactor RimP [Sphingobacteriaceae bacterium]
MTKEHIIALANQYLNGTNMYVTGIKIGSDNHINVFLDGDEGVTIKDCVAVSRAIEGNLDREKEDYALDVSSHGATTPLVMPRQYKKHIGRTFEIKLVDGTKTEGDLVEWSEHEITLESTSRENKPVGKGKITVTKQQILKYDQIKESKIKLKF